MDVGGEIYRLGRQEKIKATETNAEVGATDGLNSIQTSGLFDEQ